MKITLKMILIYSLSLKTEQKIATEKKEAIRKLVGDHLHTQVDIGCQKSLKHYYKKQIMRDAIFI